MVSLTLVGRGVVDGLANFVSGIGTGKYKASQYVYTYTPIDQREGPEKITGPPARRPKKPRRGA